MRVFCWIWFAILFWTASVTASSKATIELLVKSGTGTLTCTGGSQNPLYNAVCRQISISRVSADGGIKYEVNCTDANNVKFLLACDSFSLEYSPVVF